MTARLVGSHTVIAHNMDTRGRVVTKVDAIVEAHQESVGIQFSTDPSCKHEIYMMGDCGIEYDSGDGHDSSEGICFDGEAYQA